MTNSIPITPRVPLIDIKTGLPTRDMFLLLDALYRLASDPGRLAIIDAIRDGVTDQASSSNAVFDALALKADGADLASYLTIAQAEATYTTIAGQRTVLTADTTYHCIDYTGPLGEQSGGAGSGSDVDPFVGPQFALDWLQKNIDTVGFNVRLEIDSDIATENAPDGVNALQPDYLPLLGGGELTIAWMGGSKVTCATSGNGILSVAPFVTLENADFDGIDDSVYFTHVIANNGEIDLAGATRFGKAGLSQHQYIPGGGGLGSFGTVEVYGSAASHGAAIGGGTLASGANYTMTGSPDFSDGFVEGDNNSLIEFLGTFTGPATGALYAGLRGTSIISLNTLPGDAPGTLDATSSYNGVFGLADALIEDAINDGVTDKAPSENAVFDALAAKIGTALTLTGTTTYDPPSLGDGVGTTTTVTVTGAVLGDMALASFSLTTSGITITAWVSATDTVSVRFQNESGGTLDIGSGTLKAAILR